ncbi:MAG: carbohydrate binding family 9 domain-containing protein [Planctomycetes bacterium]|nr:carbohydrate binding family 9 domain-containing protein [Planctomycetota bacterium]
MSALLAGLAIGAVGAGTHTQDLPSAVPLRSQASVLRVERGPRIDGRLDEDCWRQAPPIGPLRQMIPRVDADPSEDTEVRLVHDGRALYFGIRCHDREPGKIVATLRQRDADLDPDDRIEIVLDTFRDRRNAYFFQIGAAGSIGDALISKNGGGFKKAWDGIFDGAARIDELGWTAEIEIPFATVAFDPSQPVWGFNLNRCIKRREEFARFAAHTRDSSFFRISQAGDLAGLDGAEQGLGIDVVPFFVLRADDQRGEDASLTGQPGLDATWRLTPSLQAAVTVNTDFAEVEVDDRQVNLTRFPLFFPEKRDFFLQDAGIFDFADLEPNVLLPFFSRRIGLDGAGNEIPILAGAKLTGRAGDWNLGFLDVETDSSGALDGQNLGAARVVYNVGEQSAVGVVGTLGDPTGAADAATYGADLNLGTSSFLGNKNLQSSAWILRTDDGTEAGEDLAYGASLRYPNDLLSLGATFAEVQSEFDPALGFVPRSGIRRWSASAELEPRHEGAIRRTQYQLDVLAVTDLDDRLESGSVELQPLGVLFDSNDGLYLELEGHRERLDEPFEIRDGVVIAPGEYDFGRARLEATFSNARQLSGSATLETGTFYDGRRDDLVLSTSWRPSALVNASLVYQRADVDLEAGDFVVHVARARLDLAFDQRVLWSNLAQVDNDSDSLGINSRLRWILSPGREFYLVVNPLIERQGDSLVATETAAAFKVAWTLRF